MWVRVCDLSYIGQKQEITYAGFSNDLFDKTLKCHYNGYNYYNFTFPVIVTIINKYVCIVSKRFITIYQIPSRFVSRHFLLKILFLRTFSSVIHRTYFLTKLPFVFSMTTLAMLQLRLERPSTARAKPISLPTIYSKKQKCE